MAAPIYIKKGQFFIDDKTNVSYTIMSDLQSRDYWEDIRNEYFIVKVDTSRVGGDLNEVQVFRTSPLFKKLNKYAQKSQ